MKDLMPAVFVGGGKATAAPRGAIPKYELIKRDITRLIAEGVYPCGSDLPSENELVEKYDASRITVRRAIDELLYWENDDTGECQMWGYDTGMGGSSYGAAGAHGRCLHMEAGQV